MLNVDDSDVQSDPYLASCVVRRGLFGHRLVALRHHDDAGWGDVLLAGTSNHRFVEGGRIVGLRVPDPNLRRVGR